MAAIQQAPSSSRFNSHRQKPSPECSIIVDDVDESDRLGKIEANTNSISEDSDGSALELASKRIEEFQRAAQGRKLEFERLLEEHAQVIKKLKKMQESECGAGGSA